MRDPEIEDYFLIGLLLAAVFCSIPFTQVIETVKVVEYTSEDSNRIEAGFGGPKVTQVTVESNRTAEIRFMFLDGVWISTKTVLLASFIATRAGYNYKGEHSTVVIEVLSDEPIRVRIIYTYNVAIESSFLSRALDSLRLSTEP
ncbi:MAG: hypothetical protein ACFFD9_03720 [Candidatus Thorarchaeota archaeon]